ncbi:MAG: hypothetical protein ABIE94_01615 [archaeon]
MEAEAKLTDKDFVILLNRILHDENHDVTNILALIDIYLDSTSSKINKNQLIFLKMYFTGRLVLFQEYTNKIYYDLREKFDV